MHPRFGPSWRLPSFSGVLPQPSRTKVVVCRNRQIKPSGSHREVYRAPACRRSRAQWSNFARPGASEASDRLTVRSTEYSILVCTSTVTDFTVLRMILSYCYRVWLILKLVFDCLGPFSSGGGPTSTVSHGPECKYSNS